jgi:hypothetical protein
LPRAIIEKYRFLIKTLSCVGWSLVWLLVWNVIVTIDFMLYLERKISMIDSLGREHCPRSAKESSYPFT